MATSTKAALAEATVSPHLAQTKMRNWRWGYAPAVTLWRKRVPAMYKALFDGGEWQYSLMGAAWLHNGRQATNGLRLAVNTYADASAELLRKATLDFYKGKLSKANWAMTMRREVETSFRVMMLVGVGGQEGVTSAHVAEMARYLDVNMRSLTAFILKLDKRTAGQAAAQAALYGAAARSAYEMIRRREKSLAGFRYERRVLGGHDHCDGCIEEAVKGWVRIGTLKPIGTAECLTNCRCAFQFSKSNPRPPAGLPDEFYTEIPEYRRARHGKPLPEGPLVDIPEADETVYTD